jgi:hypothetical protein
MMNHSCDNTDVICLDWAACSFSLTLLLFSSSEMTMRTSLLHTEQWQHDHITCSYAHSLKCFDVWWHLKRTSYFMWQLIQLAEINTPWLWIRIALMYNSWWVLIWFSVIQLLYKQNIHTEQHRMIIVWEEWAYWASCCWSTKKTESTSAATRVRTTTYAL